VERRSQSCPLDFSGLYLHFLYAPYLPFPSDVCSYCTWMWVSSLVLLQHVVPLVHSLPVSAIIIPNMLARVATLVSNIWEVPGLNLGRALTLDFTCILCVRPGKYWDSIFSYVTTASFLIPSSSFFNIITRYIVFLTAPLNIPQINKCDGGDDCGS
jgi:hypothetical protein